MTDLEFWLGEFGSLETPLTPLATPPSLVAELERWLRELSAD